MNPYTEQHLSDLTYIRKFDQSTDEHEFVWHRDREDRIISSVGDTDWLIQIDNELPKRIIGDIFIPTGVYHRLIKGTGNLIIKLEKLNDSLVL